jgi:hypothetical protein
MVVLEKTLFLCSRSVPFTLQVIHFRSALELALSFKQLGLAQTRPGRGHASVHQQGPKRYSTFAAGKCFPQSPDYLKMQSEKFNRINFRLEPE